jgi:glycosyltransferase involved in cell wall biosynthesis
LKKILYISYDGLTDPLGQSQVLPYLQHLAKYGYQFTIISFEKKGRFAKEGKTIQDIVDKSKIRWVPLSFTSSPPILSKIYDRYRMWQTAVRLQQKFQFDLIHCRSYIAAEMGLKLKQKFGVKMLFDMRGFWADEKVDNGQWDLSKSFYKRLYRHYKRKEKEFLLQADGIISLTQAAKNFLLKQPAYSSLDINVIPCCADLGHFNWERVNAEQVGILRSSLGIKENEKVISYLGSVGGWYMTKEMFCFFKRLQNLHPEYKMLILTKDNPEQVKQEAIKEGISERSLIITYSKREDLPLYISLSHFSIFFIRNSFSKTASSPTKHGELMGMGIPVVCNNIGDTGVIINETKTGILVNEFDEKSLIAGIKAMDTLSSDKSYIRNQAKKYFDLETGAQQYLSLYQKILSVTADRKSKPIHA